MTDIKYRQLADHEHAKETYRAQTLVATERSAMLMAIEVEANERLRGTVKGHAREIAQDALGKANELSRLRAQSAAIRKLMGVDDSGIPWDEIRSYIEATTAQEEELHVRAVDQAANPEAYGLSQEMADYLLASQTARVEAFHSALSDLVKKDKGKA